MKVKALKNTSIPDSVATERAHRIAHEVHERAIAEADRQLAMQLDQCKCAMKQVKPGEVIEVNRADADKMIASGVVEAI